MPTPFNHLKVAQLLLKDPQVPADCRALLNAESGAFLLGNIAADARVNSGLKRSDTHFYQYDQPISEHPWRVMLGRYSALMQPRDPAQRVFVAGYVAHLAMDEWWTKDMLREYFFEAEWGPDRYFRFFMLNILLTHMDERDYALLEDWQADALLGAQPDDWLPFMSDTDLAAWRDFIGGQIAGESQTLAVLGERSNRPAVEFRAVLDSPQRMDADLWAYVPRAVWQQVEQRMYAFSREQMLIYLAETGAHAAGS